MSWNQLLFWTLQIPICGLWPICIMVFFIFVSYTYIEQQFHHSLSFTAACLSKQTFLGQMSIPWEWASLVVCFHNIKSFACRWGMALLPGPLGWLLCTGEAKRKLAYRKCLVGTKGEMLCHRVGMERTIGVRRVALVSRWYLAEDGYAVPVFCYANTPQAPTAWGNRQHLAAYDQLRLYTCSSREHTSPLLHPLERMVWGLC